MLSRLSVVISQYTQILNKYAVYNETNIELHINCISNKKIKKILSDQM